MSKKLATPRSPIKRRCVVTNLIEEETDDRVFRAVANYALSHACHWLKANRINACMKSNLKDIVACLGLGCSCLECIRLWGGTKSSPTPIPDTVKLLESMAPMVANCMLQPKDGIVFGCMGLTIKHLVSMVSQIQVSARNQRRVLWPR